MFRERHRVVEVMNEATKGLTDDELRKLADIVSKLPQPPPVEGPPDDAWKGRAY
jgi:cytochrome c553